MPVESNAVFSGILFFIDDHVNLFSGNVENFHNHE